MVAYTRSVENLRMTALRNGTYIAIHYSNLLPVVDGHDDVTGRLASIFICSMPHDLINNARLHSK